MSFQRGDRATLQQVELPAILCVPLGTETLIRERGVCAILIHRRGTHSSDEYGEPMAGHQRGDGALDLIS
jgi:hypothetical protein